LSDELEARSKNSETGIRFGRKNLIKEEVHTARLRSPYRLRRQLQVFIFDEPL